MGGSGRFEATYRVYPVSFIDKTQLENGDKVVLPASALDRLSSLRIDYPMLFQISNPKQKKTSHCGVLEFVADEGHAYIPYWMMQNLLLAEGDLVRFKNISLSKGTYVKLRPHTSDFLDISNPKAVLEMTLRNYSCLTKDDVILVNYNNKRYFIDILETKPGEAITIIETDCEVDFAEPLDYKKEEAGAGALAAKKEEPGNLGKRPSQEAGKIEEEEPDVPTFIPFAGTGNRLDGKQSPRSVSAAGTSGGSSRAGDGNSKSNGKGQASERKGSFGKRAAGKLVFGRDSSGKSVDPDLPKPPPLVPRGASSSSADANKEKEKEEPKFQAFSGKSYKLC